MILMNENGISSDGSSLLVMSQHTFSSDFGLLSRLVTKERAVMRSVLTDKLRSDAGSASLGVLTTLVDIVTSSPALAACGQDWVATQDLTLHATGPLTEGPVVIDAQLVRIGKKMIHVSADVYDARGTTDLDELIAALDTGGEGGPVLAARALVTFARLPRAAAPRADEYTPGEWVGVDREYPVVPVDGTIYSRLGMRIVDPDEGVLELDRTPFVANMIGTIQGGAQALLAESAAHAMRPDLVATDIQMHFLSQVRVGPARSYGTVVRDGADHSVISVRLVDAGADDQLLALTTVTLQRPPARAADSAQPEL
jgi:acyl-coenzyme A thioesterase PaaI-like protein